MMIVAECLRCGHVFEAQGWGNATFTDVVMIGNMDECPRCGGRARVMDGRFSSGPGESVVVHEAPQWTVNALRRMRAQLHQAETIAKDRTLSARAAHDKVIGFIDQSIRPQNPAVADVLSEKLDAKPRKKWVTVIRRMGIAVSFLVGAVGFANDVVDLPQSIEVAREWVREAYEQAANGSPAAPGAETWRPRPPREPRLGTDPDRGWPPTTTEGPTGRPDREEHQPRHHRSTTSGP
jgi:hypothetical protein